MAYNQFSHPVAPPDLYSPIGDDILLRGAMQTYENAAKAGQNLSAYNSKLFGINTYGKDAEVLADYENQFNQNVAELSQHGISSPEAMSRMNTLISSYTNNPDILAIHRRANAYNNELQLQKEYEAKSLTYVSPIVDEGQEYFSGDTYIRDKRFSKTGWVSPNQAEDLKKAKSLVEKKIGFKENPDGTRESYEYYDPNDLKSAYLTVISSNPNYEKDALYRFEKQNRDVNWEDYSKQEHATLVQEAAIAMNLAKSLYNSAKDASSKQKALEQYTKAQQIYTMYSDAFDNPSSAEEAKYNAFNDFKNRNLQQVISAMDAEQRKPLAMNEIRKAQLDLSNDLYKEQFKSILPGAQQYNLNAGEIQSILKKGSITKNGQTITIDNLADATVQYEADAAYQKAEKSAQARAKVKEQKLSKLGNPEIKGTEQIEIGGVMQSKSLWDDFIKKGGDKKPKWTESDKSNVAAIIKEFPELFGLTSDQTYGLSGENIKINQSGKIQVSTGFFSRNIEAGDFSKLSTAVSKAGTQPPSIDTSNPLLNDSIDLNNPLLQ